MNEPAVAFLRGVNLGAHNKVPQRPLAERLERELGVPVRHLLQSGNLAVASAKPDALATMVAAAIRDDTGLEIPVIVRTAAQLADLLAANPWPDEDPVRVHLSIWNDSHEMHQSEAMLAADWSGDEIVFVPGGAWMRYARSFHEAKLGNHVIERRLKVTATARNARTIADVLQLVRSLD